MDVNNKKYYVCITPFFPTEEKFNGPFIYDQVKALQQNVDCEVVVVKVVSSSDNCCPYVYDGVKVYPFIEYRLPSYILNGIANPLNSARFKNFLRAKINIDEIAVVHCHTASCAYLGNAVKKMNRNSFSICQYHDLEPFDILNGKFAANKFNLLFKVKKIIHELNKIDLHVCVSNRSLENLMSFPVPHPRDAYMPYIKQLNLIKGLPKRFKPKSTYVLYNGVDLTKFYKVNELKSDSLFRIGCIGNYVDWKRHEVLISALKILVERGHQDIRVLLVGNNPPKGFARLKNLVNFMNLNDYIIFTPPCDHRELIKFYNSLDLFVLPSIFEGFGCVFTEAYACGVPFITCKNQGISDIVIDSDKWLIDPDNALQLADLIERFKIDRYRQILNTPIDINVLIHNFIKQIPISEK